MKLCTVPDCGTREMAKGLCSGHYQRKRLHGDPLVGGPLRKSSRRRTQGHRGDCTVDGCEREVRISQRGLCGLHYQRWRKHGDPTAFLPNRTGRSINSNGYVVLSTGSTRMVLEHRVVMEQKLGRPLLPSENVHHLNGDRTDNRLENLELWVKRQPQGQRAADLVEWATELLERYAPERLAARDDRQAA